MSINVVVSSTASGVSVSGGTSVAITVGGGIGPAGFITAPGTATTAFGTFQLVSGEGVTITTNAGQFVIASYTTSQAASFSRVQSVAGRTGHISLQAADIGGLSAVAASGSYTSLSNIPASFSPSAHTHSTADIQSFSVAAAAAAPVQKVVAGANVTVATAANGLITISAQAGATAAGAELSSVSPLPLGTATAGVSGLASRSDHVHPMPSAADVGAAAINHTHTRSSITDLTSSDIVFSPHRVLFSNVYSQLADLPSASDNHGMFAHVHATGRAYYAHSGSWVPLANQNDVSVTAVNGRTGSVSLTVADLTAASASHTHKASEITDLTSVANVVSVNGQTGVVTITASGGGTAATVSTKSLSGSQNNYDAGSGDIIRLTPSSAATLTGLAGGVDGVVRVLYNVGTHVVTLASGSTNSVATNRFSIVSGDVSLGEGDSASAWYDGTSQRWRVLEDQVASAGSGVTSINGITGTLSVVAGSNVTVTTAASSITIAAASGGGSGDGIAMSYLFG